MLSDLQERVRLCWLQGCILTRASQPFTLLGAADVMRYTEQQGRQVPGIGAENQALPEAPRPLQQAASRAATRIPDTSGLDFAHRDGEPVVKQIRQDMCLIRHALYPHDAEVLGAAII